MADESNGWSLTESDPAIFTSILASSGVKGLTVDELIGLDNDIIAETEPVHAFIFLFKYVGSHANMTDTRGEFSDPDVPFFFAQQVINNACASVALINAVMNIQDENVDLGPELSQFKAFTEDMDANTTGWALSQIDKLREAHNSFARPDPYNLTELMRDRYNDEEKEDAYHFVAFVPIGGKLYELDGLEEKPICYGEIPSNFHNWAHYCREILLHRISQYSANETHFNLMAVTSKVEANKSRMDQIQTTMRHEQLSQEERDRLESEFDERKLLKHEYALKLYNWEVDNTLRRHNYTGLIHSMLVELANSGHLQERIAQARSMDLKRKHLKQMKNVPK